MNEHKWIMVEKVAGELHAELMRGLLEAQGIPVMLLQEGAARAIGISAGPLGEVEIMVPEQQSDLAREILASYRDGELEDPD